MKFPIGLFTVVTGVSGSGKSTLINEILYKGLANQLYRSYHKVGAHKEIRGLEHIDKSSILIKALSVAHLVLILLRIQAYSMRFVNYIVKRQRLRCVGISKGRF